MKSQKGKARAKEKRSREDDIPPEPSAATKRQHDCFLELKEHIHCQAHSTSGIETYCWIELRTKGRKGGHFEVNHREMTLWAKHMVSKSNCKTDKNLPGHSPKERPRNIFHHTS